jgi:hypothetical protein
LRGEIISLNCCKWLQINRAFFQVVTEFDCLVESTSPSFVPAEAMIEGDAIVVRCAEVTAPTAARYAWAGYPEGCNFYNGAGLPAAPFRMSADRNNPGTR